MTEEKMARELSLAQLGEESGTPLRTIRYYISKGLLSGPFKAGRGACYGEEHLERLAEIRRWQSEGLTLTEIGLRLAGETVEMEQPVHLLSYQIASDVSVQIRADVSPWRLRQIQRVLKEAAMMLAQPANIQPTNKGDASENQP